MGEGVQVVDGSNRKNGNSNKRGGIENCTDASNQTNNLIDLSARANEKYFFEVVPD